MRLGHRRPRSPGVRIVRSPQPFPARRRSMKGINPLAVVVAVILHQVLGFLWYGVLFFNPWLAGLSKSASEINQSDPVPYVLDIIGWFLASYAMAWLIRKTNADSPG